MEIQLNADVKKLTRELRGIERKQIPFAVSKALNATAFDAQKGLQKALSIYLDRPTKFTINAVRVKKSEKKKDLIAYVGFAGGGGFKPPKNAGALPSEYMSRLISGGTRRPKKRAIAVPTSAFKTNQYGNIARGKIKTLLGNPRKYFSGTPKGRGSDAAGIWQRMPPNKKKKAGSSSRRRNPNAKQQSIRMVIAWEPSTHYRGGRFPMAKIVEKTVRQQFGDRFRSALKYALRTAR